MFRPVTEIAARLGIWFTALSALAVPAFAADLAPTAVPTQDPKPIATIVPRTVVNAAPKPSTTVINIRKPTPLNQRVTGGFDATAASQAPATVTPK